MNAKFMKRVLTGLLAAAMVVGCASCSSDGGNSSAPESAGGESTASQAESQDENSGEKAQITFWTFHTNKEKEFMASLPEKYKEVNSNVEVTYENFPEEDYMGSKLTTAFAADSGPDVFVMSPGDFLKYANSGVAMDLTSYFSDEIKEDFLPSSLDAMTVDGKIMGIPFEIELLGLYYNKDILEEAGVQPPKTWDELVEATRTLTNGDVAGMIVEPTKGYYQNFNWYPFLWQTGSNVLDPETKKGTFTGEGVEQALKLWADLVEAGAPTKLSIPLTNNIDLMGGGQVAMQICGTWAVPTLEKDYPDANIGLVPLPLPDGGTAATCAGGWKMLVNAKSEHANEAAEFAMWAFAEDIDLPLQWCTEVKFAYSPRKSVVEAGDEIYSKGLRQVFTDEIYDSAIGEPRYPSEIVNAVGDALQSVMLNGADPAAAAQEANDKIDKFLSTYEGSL